MDFRVYKYAAAAAAFLSAAAVYMWRPTADAALIAIVLSVAGCMVTP